MFVGLNNNLNKKNKKTKSSHIKKFIFLIKNIFYTKTYKIPTPTGVV